MSVLERLSLRFFVFRLPTLELLFEMFDETFRTFAQCVERFAGLALEGLQQLFAVIDGFQRIVTHGFDEIFFRRWVAPGWLGKADVENGITYYGVVVPVDASGNELSLATGGMTTARVVWSQPPVVGTWAQ